MTRAFNKLSALAVRNAGPGKLSEGDVWTIPGGKQKGCKDKTPDFRVPLVPETLSLIEQAKAFAREGYLFPSIRKGIISDAAMARLMERREMAARPHGFRSSLRDWIAETTNTPYEVAEATLGHAVGGKGERAYRRTDSLEQRRVLLGDRAKLMCSAPKVQ